MNDLTNPAASRRLLVWAAFVAFCVIGMAYTQLPYDKVPVIGTITYFELVLVPAVLLGIGPLMRIAGTRERSLARTMCRLVFAYLIYQVLVVVPVALWLGSAKLTAILSELAVRFTWLLFPVVLALCADDRIRRRAGIVAIVGAACLVAWGIFSAATGGAGYYMEFGDVRYRVLYGGALMLFAWPFVLALSRDVTRRSTIPLLGIPLIGLVLTNMRSGYIAFAVAGIACLVTSKQVKRAVLWIVPAALIGIVVALAWGRQVTEALGYTMTHLLDFSSGNGADRVTRDVLAWNFFVRYPFNDYVWSWRYYLVYVQDAYGAHNFALNVAVTEGVAGLIFYAAVLWTAFRDTWKWVWEDVEARALTFYLVAYVIFQFANGGWYAPVNIALLVAAVAALVARIDRLRSGEASEGPAWEAPYRARPTRGAAARLAQVEPASKGGDGA